MAVKKVEINVCATKRGLNDVNLNYYIIIFVSVCLCGGRGKRGICVGCNDKA